MAAVERVVIPYAPRPLQRELHDNRARFSVIVCHRRWGKTVWAINELLKAAITCTREAPRFAYVAPLYRQAKAVAWDYVKRFSDPIPGRVYNEAELRVDLPGGARITLFGADNPDSLRGLYLDGVVLDEYAQMSPKAWTEVLRPALADRQGWAAWIGTPQGHGHFFDLYERAASLEGWSRHLYKASETGIVADLELKAAKREMAPAEYAQEFECSWAAAVPGAYYGELIQQAEEQGRVTKVPYDPSAKVETWWDLGVGDSTVVWFAQRVGHAIHLIDYYEMTGVGLNHYVQHLDSKGYAYSRHIAPHDVQVRELGTGQSRLDIARGLGLEFEVAPKLPVDDGIAAVRQILPRCYFDREKTQYGIDCLRQYRAEYDDRLRTVRPKPLHDWTSHAADAFRYGAVAGAPLGVNAWRDYDPSRLAYSVA
jgi:hypothetical protein